MTDSTVRVIKTYPNVDGSEIDCEAVTRGDEVVNRQRVAAFITDGAGTANTKQLGDQLTTNEVGLVTNTIIHGQTTGGGGGYRDVKVTPSGALTVDIGNDATDPVPVSQPKMAVNASGYSRVSFLTTLFDGKTLNTDDTFKWNTVGSGSQSFSGNAMTLSVTAGQYAVRQAKHWNPYFSGKPQLIETTYINFAYETGVIKRGGYFSSSAVAPYSATLDGIYLESDGVNNTYRLVCSRAGTETHNIPWTSWDNYAAISGYDWSKFSVNEIDFLWLGGAALRLFLVVNGVFTLIHTIDNHAGTQGGLIIQSPNQPVRYEIRSTTGSGSLTCVCSQVAVEGGESEEGEELSLVTDTAVACNAAGTLYALKGVRKTATNRNFHVDIESFSAALVTPATDAGMLLLILNPTISAGSITWAANSRVEEGTPVAGTTLTARTGRILGAVPMNASGAASATVRAGLKSLPIDIDNTPGTVILAYRAATATQDALGQITVIEY